MSDPNVRDAWLRALELTAPIAAAPSRILPNVIEELAVRFGEAPALLSEGGTLSYRDLAVRANQYARWALDQGLGKGDALCLLMPNSPEYLAIWLGLSGVGVVVALINTQLRGASLAHCINTVRSRHAIVAGVLAEQFASARDLLAAPAQEWRHGDGGGPGPRVDIAADALSGRPLDPTERPAVTLSDRALYIYTSGTTGLPKAANVSHYRVMAWSHWFAGLTQSGPEDRLFNCLPMYHSIGGVAAPGALLVSGGSVVIRDGFSARRFWDDIADWDCTLFQYIGELCRYLVSAPPHPRERAHRLRLCCGNGLRAEIWAAFQSRFAIPRILEFYAATEGVFSLYNVEGRLGAIGRIPGFIAHRFPVVLVAYDTANDMPARDAGGFCIRCGPDEVGEAIARLDPRQSRPEHAFEGYVSAADSERRILRDVFAPGDAWVRSGDLMRKDRQGYFFFVDRVGDTFRWKGENVATLEVAAVAAAFPDVSDAMVYGVAVPGTEGRAGMAAIVVQPGFELARFRRHLQSRLPTWARPLFLRICGEASTTATFRAKTHELSGEGFDPEAISDPLYFDDVGADAFVPLDAALHGRIVSGGVRL